MEEQYRMYLAYLEDLRKQLESLTALAKEKPPAVAADDLAALNDIMKREQVLSLTPAGLRPEAGYHPGRPGPEGYHPQPAGAAQPG